MYTFFTVDPSSVRCRLEACLFQTPVFITKFARPLNKWCSRSMEGDPMSLSNGSVENLHQHQHELPVFHKAKKSGKASALTLLGLPEHVTLQCLARVPASCLWRICHNWQKLVYECDYFQSLRLECGLPVLQWIYALVRFDDGNYKWYAYDPLACVWHSLPLIPESLGFQLSHSLQCVTTRTKLIMLAGLRCLKKNGSSQPQLEPALDCPLIFDTRKREWTKGSPFRVPRKWCACGTVGEKLMVASGCGREWQLELSKSVEIYDTDTKTWCVVEDLNTSKFSGEAIVAVNIGGKLHMVSGKGVFWKVGAILDVSTGSWTEMPAGMRKGWTGSCVVVDGRMFMLDECAHIGRLKVYDEEEDAWKIYLEDELLRGMGDLVAGPGTICGIVRSGTNDNGGRVIRIVDVRFKSVPLRTIDVQSPPQGQVIAVQVLQRMRLDGGKG